MSNEETPLLDRAKKITPLPKLQFAIVLILYLCAPVIRQFIYPYINQLVSELDITGGDEKKVGYYAGLIESVFFAAEAVTVFQWSRISDHVGRKPILMIGLLGTAISLLCFGLSRSFWTLLISRCLCGSLFVEGVIKSVLGEVTDATNRAQAFALMLVVWAIGSTLGPLMGGSLSRPHAQFPNVFTGALWKNYPYLLPSIVASSFVLLAFLITACLFKETVPKRTSKVQQTLLESSQCTCINPPQSPIREAGPLPLRELLTFPVVISISNFVALAFLNISLSALLPLFFAMPVHIGGMGLSPATIGYCLSLSSTGSVIFQALFFARIIHRLGERRVFMMGMTSFIPIFCLIPIISIDAKHHGVSSASWVLVTCILVLMGIMDMAYGSIFMYITASPPNKHSLGATNGLSQTTVSIARAIGPAMSTSLFSFSVQKNILSGYGVYALLTFASCLALILAARLPYNVWPEHDGSSED